MALDPGYTNINSLLQANPNLYGNQYRQMNGMQAPQYQNPTGMQNQSYQMPNDMQTYSQDTLNPQFQYQVGAPEPQQEPSFQRQPGAEQPGQVWQQGLQQAMQDGTLREYLDKTVYKRGNDKQSEEEKKKKEALTSQGENAKGYTSTPYQMDFKPVSILLR